MIDSWLQDVRYAIRLLARNPLFALTAVVSLAIGIGANTTIFAIANALLFRAPAGVVDADRIVDIGRSQNGEGFDNNSYPNYLDVRARNTVFTQVYAQRFAPEPMSLGAPGGAERVYGSIVSANYFAALGTRAAAGRLFSGNERQEPGAAPYAVLSHAFWTRRYRQDPQVVGRQVLLSGHPFTVVGVAEPGFQGTTLFAADLWVPMNMIAEAMPRLGAGLLTDRRAVWLIMGGRLKPGVTVAQARAELTAIGATLERAYPEENRGRGLRVEPLSLVPGNSAPIAAFVAGLMVVAGLVLTIACANLAGVLLARATSRRREIAVRLALGAGRARLVRQMLVETSLLFLGGAALGLLLARTMTGLFASLLPALPVQIGLSLGLDGRAVAFTFGLSLLAAILCGLVPAFHASRRAVAGALKAETQGSPERQRLRSVFVVGQVALSIVLVVAASLFVRALQRADSIDAGFDPRGVEIATLELSLAGYDDTTGPVFARELIRRVRAIPGVESATLSAALPLGLGGMGLGYLTLPGGNPQRDHIEADWNIVEPGYFVTLRTPLVAGRDFNDGDRANAPFVTIVNQAMAARLWPNQNPIGKTLVQYVGLPGTPNASRTMTVVGVARDAKYRSLSDQGRLFLYVPLQQQYDSGTNIIARARGNRRLAAELRAVVASMNPSLPIINAQSLEELAAIGLMPQRIAASVSGSLGIVGLLLAAIGIYGVTAYMVTSRTREIGIRMALGAMRADVVRMVLRHGMRLLVIGVGIGLLLALAASRVLASLLFGVGATDPVAFAGSAILFCLIGLAACYVPARRATQIEATVALRYE